MAINFPSSPANNQTYSYGGQSWYWANNYGVWQPRSGPSFTNSSTAPSTPLAGDLWWNTENGILYTYYDDGTSSQWVAAAGVPPGSVSTPGVTTGKSIAMALVFGG